MVEQERSTAVVVLILGNLRVKTTVNGYGWTSTQDLGWAFLHVRKSYGMVFCLPLCFTTVSFAAFLVVVKDLQRVASKVRILYVTQRNNTFLFLFELFSEFTNELRLLLKEVTLICQVFFHFFFSEFTKVREWKHGYPRWKFVSKPQ